MEVQDVPAIVAAAKAKGVLVGCDNTWATPLLFKPLEHGADFACEALTKYVGGHSDLLLGSITVTDMALRQKLKEMLRGFGIGVSPDECRSRCAASRPWACAWPISGEVSEDFARAADEVARGRARAASGPAVLPRPRDLEARHGALVGRVQRRAEAGRRGDARRGADRAGGLRDRRLLGRHAQPDRADGGRGRPHRHVPGRRRAPLLRISIGLEDPDDLWNDLDALLVDARTGAGGQGRLTATKIKENDAAGEAPAVQEDRALTTTNTKKGERTMKTLHHRTWIALAARGACAMAQLQRPTRSRRSAIAARSSAAPAPASPASRLQDANGRWQGFDIDICRALAVVIFNDHGEGQLSSR